MDRIQLEEIIGARNQTRRRILYRQHTVIQIPRSTAFQNRRKVGTPAQLLLGILEILKDRNLTERPVIPTLTAIASSSRML